MMAFSITGIKNYLSNLSRLSPTREFSENSPLIESICAAIIHRRTIRIKYKRESAFRTFNSYSMYYSPRKKDVVLICGLQFDDKTGKSEPVKFKLSHITEIVVTDKNFDYDIHWRINEFEFVNGIICLMKP